MKLNARYHWLLLIPILLAVAGLATHQIDRFPISVDELLSMNNAGYYGGDASPIAVLDNLGTYSQQHVPLYFLILGMASDVFGWTPPALRMIGVWFGLLALTWVYRLGRDHFNSMAGIYSVLFVAGMTLYSFYYAHIRMYPLLVFGAAMFLWFYLRATDARHTPSIGTLAGLSMSTLLFLSTHIFSITLALSVGVYHLLIVSKSRRWWMVSGAVVVGGLPLVAWLPVLLRGFQHTSTFSIVTQNALSSPEILLDMMIVYSNGVIPLLLLWVGGALYIAWRHDSTVLRWLGLAGMTGVIILVIGGLVPIIPPDRLRYTLVLIIPLAIAFGGTLANHRVPVMVAGVIVVAWLATDVIMHRNYDMARYLGGRMNIYNMPHIDEQVPLIYDATDGDTLLLSFSNHHDLTLAVRHGNTIQDFYYDSIQRAHYSIFIPQELLKANDEIEAGALDAIDGWSRVAWIESSEHAPPKRIRNAYLRALQDFTVCQPIQLSADITLTYYVQSPTACDM